MRAHRGRRLCSTCYGYLLRHNRDALLDYPRTYRRTVDLAADAQLIRARHGGTWPEVASRLGVPFATLDKARQRARQQVAS